MDQYNIKSKTNYREALEKETHYCRKVNKNEVIIIIIIIIIIKRRRQ
jgi:hypothetical protein